MITRITRIDDQVLHALSRADEFYMEACLPGKFNMQQFLMSWQALLKAGFGAMWKYTHGDRVAGLMGAMLCPDLNDGEVIASESFLYVLKEYRGRTGGVHLINEFERWAKDIGAKRIVMTYTLGVDDAKFEKFFSKRGFRSCGRLFVRELS